MKIRIKDFHISIGDDIRRCNLACTRSIYAYHARLLAIHFEAKLFQIQYDTRDIVAYARYRGELVENPVDPDGGYCSALQRRKQYAAQAVAQRRAIAALQRFADKFAIAVIIADFFYLDFWFFDFVHL